MKKILIVGATGHLGPHLAKEFVKQGHQVSAMLRPASLADPNKSDSLMAQGIKLIEGDLSAPGTLKGACAGQDVVVSAIGGEQIMMQTLLAEAAFEAGVERFIPSEFGLDPHAAGSGSCDLFDIKASVQEKIKATGVPTTMIYTNGFMEFWGTGLGQLGPMEPPTSVQLFGNGDVPAYMCTLGDIARFVAAIIEDPNTVNREVAICTNSITQNDLISLWESKSGRMVTRQKVSSTDLDQTIEGANNPKDMMTRIFNQLHRSVWIRSDCNKVRSGVLQATALYPQIETTGLEDYFSYFL